MDHADEAGDILDRAMARYRPNIIERKARLLGQCDECGDDIDPDRLARYPFAVRCVGCQAEYEQAAKRRR